jgi:hypothetical protein
VVAWLGSGRKTTAWQAFVGRAAEKPPRLAGSVKKAEVLLGRCGMGRGKEAGCTTPWAERRIRTRDNFWNIWPLNFELIQTGFWNLNECFGFSKIEVGTLIQGFESNGLTQSLEYGNSMKWIWSSTQNLDLKEKNFDIHSDIGVGLDSEMKFKSRDMDFNEFPIFRKV